MKKRFVVMLLTLGALCVGLTGCGNADSSLTVPPPETTTTTATAEEQSVTTTTTTTTSQTEQTELTTSSEVTSSTSVSDVTEISVPSSEVETTTTTTTTTAIVTEPKVTTTTTKATTTKPKTTTTKVTTTTKPKTTTTTTTKKVDDSKYEITGILACYDRLRRGVSTAEDRQKIIDDLCQYTINKFDGKSGDIVYECECTSKEACEYLRDLWGYDFPQSQKITTVEVPIKLEVVDTFTFDNNALLNIGCDTQGGYNEGETAEEAYYEALYFQGTCYATAERGIASYVRNMSWNEWGEGETMPIYFCIENDAIGDKAVDWWTVWFLCGG